MTSLRRVGMVVVADAFAVAVVVAFAFVMA
jgi:hypothetical protein